MLVRPHAQRRARGPEYFRDPDRLAPGEKAGLDREPLNLFRGGRAMRQSFPQERDHRLLAGANWARFRGRTIYLGGRYSTDIASSRPRAVDLRHRRLW